MISPARYAWVVLLGSVALIPTLLAEEPATQDTAKATLLSATVQKVQGETYFRVRLRWPSNWVPEDYNRFVKGTRQLWSMRASWPPDALMLIPQSAGAWGVFREGGFDGALPAEASFVGKLRDTGTAKFMLRCPRVKGQYRYLPLDVEFGAPIEGEDLAKAWADAELTFLSAFPSAPDLSFFAYARERLSARMGRTVPAPRSDFGNWNPAFADRSRLYDITTGALAIQESLQLDRMRNPRQEKESDRTILVTDLPTVTVQSHPWTEMIGDRKPAIDPLAQLVPEDNYYVRFRTTRALREFLDFADHWGGSVLSQMDVGGRDYGVRDKLETQICLKSTWLAELLGPAVIDSLALTGADPYLREGSDFSIIFRLKAPPVFESAVKRYLDEARRAHPDLTEKSEDYQGITIEAMTTPDRVVSCYRAASGEYRIYSNSPAGIRRILDAQAGRVPALGKALDFAYMRTVYPESDPKEDGFIFLSDPFIRALVGPRLRIAEKRRLETVTSMEMIKNAAMLYLWERPGSAVPALEELYQARYLDPNHVRPEVGDRLTWDPQLFRAESERYGRLGYLRPLIETPVDRVTPSERDEYEQFRIRYQSYWRRYFDPIGVRITTGQTMAISLTILPLIDNSEYDNLTDSFGGEVTTLAPAQRTGPRIFHFAAHLNPESRTLKEIQSFMMGMVPEGQRASLDWIGERIEVWLEDSDAYLELLRDQRFPAAFKLPVAVGIQVKNPLTLATFLVGLQGMVKVSAPNMVTFQPTEPYRDFAFTAIRPAADGMLREADFKDAAFYYGTVNGYLYVSTSLDVLHRIVDGLKDGAASQPAVAGTADPAGRTEEETPTGHMAFSIVPANAQKAQAALDYYFAGEAWDAESEHLRSLWLVAHTLGAGREGVLPAERVLGYRVESALGNTYRFDPTRDEVVGSVTGPLWQAWPRDQLPEQAPVARLIRSLRQIQARLQFTRHGLQTDLTIERN